MQSRKIRWRVGGVTHWLFALDQVEHGEDCLVGWKEDELARMEKTILSAAICQAWRQVGVLLLPPAVLAQLRNGHRR